MAEFFPFFGPISEQANRDVHQALTSPPLQQLLFEVIQGMAMGTGAGPLPMVGGYRPTSLKSLRLAEEAPIKYPSIEGMLNGEAVPVKNLSPFEYLTQLLTGKNPPPIQRPQFEFDSPMREGPVSGNTAELSELGSIMQMRRYLRRSLGTEAAKKMPTTNPPKKAPP